MDSRICIVKVLGLIELLEDAQIQSWTLLIDQFKAKEQPFEGVVYPLLLSHPTNLKSIEA